MANTELYLQISPEETSESGDHTVCPSLVTVTVGSVESPSNSTKLSQLSCLAFWKKAVFRQNPDHATLQ